MSANLDVLTIGEALVDLIAPDAETLEEADRFLRAAGGAPANVAVAVARLGGRSAVAGAVGNDPFGQFLRATLAENGVNLSALRVVPQRTTVAFVARNRGGIPDFVFYRGSDAAYSPEDLPLDLLSESRFVHVSSMALMSEPSRTATLRAVEEARSRGALVSVDPNLRPTSWPSLADARNAIGPLLELADIVKVNDDEARLLTNEARLDGAGPRVGRDDSLRVVTLGEEGCRWWWRGESGAVNAPRVSVEDTTGAGDAFVGALLAELSRLDHRGETFRDLPVSELERCLRFACAAASISCSRAGAMHSLPTRSEMQSLL